MSNAYNFHCNNPQLAARIASLRTCDIENIFKACFGVTVNIMQKFAKPPKCKAAEYIVDNAPGNLLAQHMATNMGDYEAAANNSAGRPVNKYHHDANCTNEAWRQQSRPPRVVRETPVQIEQVPHSVTIEQDDETNEIRQIVNDANNQPDASPDDSDAADKLAQAIAAIMAGQTPTLDVEAVARIARHEASEIFRAINAPTRVHVVSRDNDNSEVVRDLGLQHKDFATLVRLAQVRGPDGFVYPIWLPGPAGSGKTTAAKNVSKSLNIPFHHNGAIDTEYKLLGFTDANGTFHETPFYKAYKHGGVYLFDEVDASAPQALVAMNAALENGSCTFGNGECVPRHEDCIIIAAANTFGMGATHEYVGRNKLDAATVDRFIMLSWEYDEALERAIAQHDEWVTFVQKIRSVVKTMAIKHVVSPRASYRGADMLRAGLPREYVMQAVVFKGMSAEQAQTVMQRAGVR